MEYLSIDRIEGNIAVCEADDRSRREIPVSEIEGCPREGDVLCCDGERCYVDHEETKRRRDEAVRLQKLLFHKNK